MPSTTYANSPPAIQTETLVLERTFTAPVKMFMHASESDRAMARFRRLKHLPENHDGEGAAAPRGESIDFAMSFLARANFVRTCLPTLSEDGQAVIEMHDRNAGAFADVTFVAGAGGMVVQCYVGRRDQPSDFVEGQLDDAKVREILGDAGCVFYD